MPRWASAAGITLFAVAMLNFWSFLVVALLIGGDALSGKAENGRYYLSSHGRHTEVSRAVWHYSKIHTISVLVTHPLGIGCAWLAAYAERKKRGPSRTVAVSSHLPQA
jgi:hypothetical protein